MSNYSGLKSFSVKLYLLMASAVFLTGLAVTLQSSDKFKNYIEESVEDATAMLAEKTANDVSNLMDAWVSNLTGTLNKSQTNKLNNLNLSSDLESALNENKDIWAASLYSVGESGLNAVGWAAQTHLVEPSNAKKNQRLGALKSLMDSAAKEFASSMSSKGPRLLGKNTTPEGRAPSILIATKLDSSANNKQLILVFIADMTKLQLALPSGRHTSSYIVDSKGNIFASPDDGKVITKNPVKNNFLIQRAKITSSTLQFIPRFKDHMNRDKIGAIIKASRELPFFIVIEKDRTAAFGTLSRLCVGGALWTFLAFLIMAIFVYALSSKISENIKNIAFYLERISRGDLSGRIQTKSQDEFGLLGFRLNQMTSKIQEVIITATENATHSKDHEISGYVDKLFSPQNFINKDHLSIATSLLPAKERSGGFCGHYSLSKNIDLLFVGNVSERGALAAVSIAVLMTALQSALRFFAEPNVTFISPAKILKELNALLADLHNGHKTTTLFLAVIDLSSGTLWFSNAGHISPFVVSGDGSQSLDQPGSALGSSIAAEFHDCSINLQPGDRLVIFTKGLLENSSVSGDIIERQMLMDLASANTSPDVETLQKNIITKVMSAFGTENLAGDIILLSSEIKKSWSGSSIRKAENPVFVQNHPPVSSNRDGQFVIPPPPPPRKKSDNDPNAGFTQNAVENWSQGDSPSTNPKKPA